GPAAHILLGAVLRRGESWRCGDIERERATARRREAGRGEKPRCGKPERVLLGEPVLEVREHTEHGDTGVPFEERGPGGEEARIAAELVHHEPAHQGALLGPKER